MELALTRFDLAFKESCWKGPWWETWTNTNWSHGWNSYYYMLTTKCSATNSNLESNDMSFFGQCLSAAKYLRQSVIRAFTFKKTLKCTFSNKHPHLTFSLLLHSTHKLVCLLLAEIATETGDRFTPIKLYFIKWTSRVLLGTEYMEPGFLRPMDALKLVYSLFEMNFIDLCTVLTSTDKSFSLSKFVHLTHWIATKRNGEIESTDVLGWHI